MIFGRKKDQAADQDAAAVTTEPQPGGKGYTPPKGAPTPRRSQAQAQRQARVKAPKDRKEANRQLRERRAAEQAKTREAMTTGDDRYLPIRDKGPVRRAVRNFVDARLMFSELAMPIMLLMLIVLVLRLPNAEVIVSNAWILLIVLVVLDLAVLFVRLRRMLRREFPDQSTKGALSYGLLRATQIRPLRLPKPQVRIGGAKKEPKKKD